MTDKQIQDEFDRFENRIKNVEKSVDDLKIRVEKEFGEIKARLKKLESKN